MLVSIASLARVLGLTWVGMRMLLLARRTRSLPELLLGISFLSFSALGVPLLLASGYSAARVSDVNLPLMAVALGLLDLGTVCFAAFVCRVFRPGTAAGASAVVGVALALGAHVVLATSAVAAAAPNALPHLAIGWRGWILSSVMSATFVWGGVEALAYWAQLRRRLALGLAEPVAVRRMLYFALGCGAQLLMMAFNALASVRDTNPLTDPLPALGIAIASLATAGAFVLALGAQRSRSEVASVNPSGA